MRKFMVRILKGINDPHDYYFDTLVEARIFVQHNGGNIWRRVNLENSCYWAKV